MKKIFIHETATMNEAEEVDIRYTVNVVDEVNGIEEVSVLPPLTRYELRFLGVLISKYVFEEVANY